MCKKLLPMSILRMFVRLLRRDEVPHSTKEHAHAIHDLVKADTNSEAGILPDQQRLTEMGKYNEALG